MIFVLILDILYYKYEYDRKSSKAQKYICLISHRAVLIVATAQLHPQCELRFSPGSNSVSNVSKVCNDENPLQWSTRV